MQSFVGYVCSNRLTPAQFARGHLAAYPYRFDILAVAALLVAESNSPADGASQGGMTPEMPKWVENEVGPADAPQMGRAKRPREAEPGAAGGRRTAPGGGAQYSYDAVLHAVLGTEGGGLPGSVRGIGWDAARHVQPLSEQGPGLPRFEYGPA